MSHHFGLIDDAPLLAPAFCAIAALAIEMLGLSSFLRPMPDDPHGTLGQALQHRVGTQFCTMKRLFAPLNT